MEIKGIMSTFSKTFAKQFNFTDLFFLTVELAWCSSSVMDCHATAWGLIPGRNSVFTELHVRKGK